MALLVTAMVGITNDAEAIELDLDGDWSGVQSWPLLAIHAAHSSTGDVVTYGTNGDGTQTGRFIYDVWDPQPSASSGHQTLQKSTQTDLFCSLQLNRVDNGQMLLFGGDNWTGSGTTNTGNPDINVYDPASRQIQQLPGMKASRWYASAVTLTDGSIFIMGGANSNDTVEHWTPESGSQLLPFSTAGLDWWYPRLWLAPDSRIFGFDSQGQMFWISADLSSLTRAGRIDGYPSYGNSTTSAMYEPGKILVFGGASNRSWTIDINGSNPVVNRSGNLSSSRVWGNGTLLPDGRVFANGGGKRGEDVNNGNLGSHDPAYSAEIWNPATGQWRTVSSAARARLYHSTALLLADGRVLTAGGGAPGPQTNVNAEIFTPDYLRLSNGNPTPRPSINSVSATEFDPGNTLSMRVSGDVSRVTLLRAGSVTHSFNMTQRFLELDFDQSGDQITTQLPSGRTTVPPGYWFVTVIDSEGVPSESRMVKVRAGGTTVNTPVGGGGGAPFRIAVDEPGDLASIRVGAGDTVASLQMVSRTEGATAKAGGTAATSTATLNQGEYITEVFGRNGTLIDQIGFRTNTGRTLGPYGGGGGQPFSLKAGSGKAIVGLAGKSGSLIDSLSIITAPTRGAVSPGTVVRSATVGGSGGADYRIEVGSPTDLGSVRVGSSSFLDSLQLFSRSEGASAKAGGGGALATGTLNQGEYITEVFGRNGSFIDQVGFRTNTGRTLGTYGGGGGQPFTLTAPAGQGVVGFTGKAGLYIDSIAILTKAVGAAPEPPDEPAPPESLVINRQAGTTVVPARIDAENYQRAGDTDAGNQGLASDFDGNVDIWPKLGGDGFIVGRTRSGEFISYRIRVPEAGEYRVALSHASGLPNGGTATVRIGGVKVGPTISLGNTSGWWNFTDTTIGTMDLQQQDYVLTIQWGRGQSNLEAISVARAN